MTIEPLLQYLRIRKARPYISKNGVLVDLGCDDPPELLNSMCEEMERCIGVDVIDIHQVKPRVEIVIQDLKKKINLPSNIADTITILAVLEHMKYPEDVIKESHRILRKGGRLLITVPSPQYEWLLEILADVGLVRREMIDQHENYFTHEALVNLCQQGGFSEIEVSSFELGMNTFMVAVKT